MSLRRAARSMRVCCSICTSSATTALGRVSCGGHGASDAIDKPITLNMYAVTQTSENPARLFVIVTSAPGAQITPCEELLATKLFYQRGQCHVLGNRVVRNESVSPRLTAK